MLCRPRTYSANISQRCSSETDITNISGAAKSSVGVCLMCCFSVLIIFLCRFSALPSNVDIKPSLILKAGVEKTGTRPRGMGKLLSIQKEVGLALLRLEHVAGIQRGEIKLDLEISTEGDQQMFCSVIPFWPEWWPSDPPSKDCSSDSTQTSQHS